MRVTGTGRRSIVGAVFAGLIWATWEPWTAGAQEIGVHNVVFTSGSEDDPLGPDHEDRVVVNVTVRWTPESRHDGVWLFLHARAGDAPWQRIAIDRTRVVATDALLTAGPAPRCHVEGNGPGVVCRVENGVAADVRWVVTIPAAPSLDPEGLEIVASGLRVSSEAPPSGSGPRVFAAAERVTEAVYADFLSLDRAPAAERAARADRFCGGGCSLERAGDRYVAHRAQDTRAVPAEDRLAFARWAGLDERFRVPPLQ